MSPFDDPFAIKYCDTYPCVELSELLRDDQIYPIEKTQTLPTVK